MEGEPLTKHDFWFGQTYYQQISSTVPVIPLLLRLAVITGELAYISAAVKAGRYVRAPFVNKIKHNGDMRDSVYGKPQLVDH